MADNVQYVKVASNQWELRVADAVLGHITADSALLFNNKVTYRARTTFTVAGEGLRRYGGDFDTLEQAKEKLTSLMFSLYNGMKKEFEPPCDLGSEAFDPHNI